MRFFDATVGDIFGEYRVLEHNSLNAVVEIKASLRTHIKGCFIAYGRALHTSHGELVERMKPHDIEVAFEGCELEIKIASV